MEDFMVREVTFIPLEASYYDIFRLLKCTSFRAYPLVDSEGVYIYIYTILLDSKNINQIHVGGTI